MREAIDVIVAAEAIAVLKEPEVIKALDSAGAPYVGFHFVPSMQTDAGEGA